MSFFMGKAQLRDHIHNLVTTKREEKLKDFADSIVSEYKQYAQDYASDKTKIQTLASKLHWELADERYIQNLTNINMGGLYEISELEDTMIKKVRKDVIDHLENGYTRQFPKFICDLVEKCFKEYRAFEKELWDLKDQLNALISSASSAKLAYQRLKDLNIPLPEDTGSSNLPAVINIQANIDLLIK